MAAPSAAGANVTYEVFCPTMRFVDPAQVHIGDTLYKNNGHIIGTVTGVRVMPTVSEAVDPAPHKVIQYQSTIAQDVIISAKTNGLVTSTGVAVGDLLLHSGAPMPVMTSTFDCDTAFITNLKIDGKP